MVSLSSSMSFTTTLAPPISICGSLTAGAKTRKGESTFTMIAARTHPGARRAPIMAGAKCANIIRDNALMWFEEYHADGLRWDMIVYIKSIDGNAGNPANDIPEGWSLMQWINVEIQQRFPGKISIAEGMHKNAWVTKDAGAGGAGFNAQWDAEFVHHVRQAVIVRDDSITRSGGSQ